MATYEYIEDFADLTYDRYKAIIDFITSELEKNNKIDEVPIADYLISGDMAKLIVRQYLETMTNPIWWTGLINYSISGGYYNGDEDHIYAKKIKFRYSNTVNFPQLLNSWDEYKTLFEEEVQNILKQINPNTNDVDKAIFAFCYFINSGYVTIDYDQNYSQYGSYQGCLFDSIMTKQCDIMELGHLNDSLLSYFLDLLGITDKFKILYYDENGQKMLDDNWAVMGTICKINNNYYHMLPTLSVYENSKFKYCLKSDEYMKAHGFTSWEIATNIGCSWEKECPKCEDTTYDNIIF